jgi:UDP-4-amino-4-deoxy-L-arabinose-oxoglutarate aminotransferase
MEPGYKYNMPELLAALGLAQLERWKEFNQRRQILAEFYLEGLKGLSGIDLPGVPAYEHIHAWHLFIIKIQEYPRDRFMNRLSEYNIGYGLHFPSAHTLSYINKKYGKSNKSLQETNRAADRIISLPLFPDMKEDDVHYVCMAIKEILKNG